MNEKTCDGTNDFLDAIKVYDKDWLSMEFLGNSFMVYENAMRAIKYWQDAYMIYNSGDHLKNSIEFYRRRIKR